MYFVVMVIMVMTMMVVVVVMTMMVLMLVMMVMMVVMGSSWSVLGGNCIRNLVIAGTRASWVDWK